MSQIAINNAGFDVPFYEQDGIGQLTMADGWRIVWVEGPESDRGFLVRPEAYRKVLPSGDVCQGVQSTSATHLAAVTQAVVLPTGVHDLALEVRVAYHGPASGMACKVGLDGTGQVTNIEAPTIQWGRWLNQDGDPPWPMGTFCAAKAALHEVESGYVSLWLLSRNKWRGRNNHVFWLDVTLTADEDEGPADPATAAGKIMAAIDLLLEAVELL